jgi:3-demethoxyubiquinol 3-hydroxylase
MNLDRLIVEFDKGLRAAFATPTAQRPAPGRDLEEPALSGAERREAASLMRVNHCGEVCAQALYQGQALASRNAKLREELDRAAREESDHLAWSAERIAQLGGRPSALNPLWYAGSFLMGYAAGRLGDGWNLGFLAETERQVERHLTGHLDRLSAADVKTRAIMETMRREEAGHADKARSLGARELPPLAKQAMRIVSRFMTATAYWV